MAEEQDVEEPEDLGDDDELHCPLELLEAHEAIAFAEAEEASS